MPAITYFIRCTRRTPRSGIPYVETEHTDLTEAWAAFRYLAEPDSADVYTEIELAEHSWEGDGERCLARLTLGERYSA